MKKWKVVVIILLLVIILGFGIYTINENRKDIIKDNQKNIINSQNKSLVDKTNNPDCNPENSLIIKSNNIVVNNPPLINLPDKNIPVQLNIYLVNGNREELISPDNISYRIYHPVNDQRMGDPSSIISIDKEGNARYLREGYVFVDAELKDCSVVKTKNYTILATGNIYGNPDKDKVIAIFPKDYSTRESGTHTFGEMMQNYPDAIKTFNLAYDLTSKMYGNFKPFNGDKQIFSIIVSVQEPENPFACGNMNPLESDPTCYLMPDGTPGYGAPIHEMGHNFGQSKGLQQLVFSNDDRMNRGTECIASLPEIFMYADFSLNSEKYGIEKDSYEYNYFKSHLEGDIPTVQPNLDNFENSIKEGDITGYFDDAGNFDKVATFCDFFQIYAYNLTDDENIYKQEVIPRWLGIFSDRELPNFEENKSETYFAASYSAAVGHDMRNKLRFWGFTIDDDYFNQIYPMLQNEVDNK